MKNKAVKKRPKKNDRELFEKIFLKTINEAIRRRWLLIPIGTIDGGRVYDHVTSLGELNNGYCLNNAYYTAIDDAELEKLNAKNQKLRKD